MASKNLLPEPYAKVITLSIMKSLFPCVLSILLLPLVSCIHTGSSNSDPLTFSTDQTVMLHWLEVDDNGVVREAETDGNQTKQKEAFSGKAIETFEQSPTKSISENAHRLSIKTAFATDHPENFVLPANCGVKKLMPMIS